MQYTRCAEELRSAITADIVEAHVRLGTLDAQTLARTAAHFSDSLPQLSSSSSASSDQSQASASASSSNQQKQSPNQLSIHAHIMYTCNLFCCNHMISLSSPQCNMFSHHQGSAFFINLKHPSKYCTIQTILSRQCFQKLTREIS